MVARNGSGDIFANELTITGKVRRAGDANTWFGFINDDEFKVVTGNTTTLIIHATTVSTNNNDFTAGTGSVTATTLTVGGETELGGDTKKATIGTYAAAGSSPQKFTLAYDSTPVIEYYNSLTVLPATYVGGDLTVIGDITANDFITTSDKRIKKDINTIEDGLGKVSELRGVTYTNTRTNKSCVGVIAQEVEEVLPDVVHEGENGMKAVAYGNMVGVLIEAVKELKEKVEYLESKSCKCEHCGSFH